MIERPIFLIHIPKTAGTSIRTLLKRICADRPFVEMPLRRDQRAAAAQQFGARDVVVGHVGYGLRERFPTTPFTFTFLRDPIARSLSNFSFLQQRSMDPAVAEDAADFVAAKGISLGEFIRHQPEAASRHVGNLSVWFLTRDGIEPREDLRKLDRGDLETAERNLERLDMIGLVERMAESILWLAWSLDCPPTLIRPMPFDNVLGTSLHARDVDDRTRQLLAETCSLDLELYQFASELFAKRLADQLPRIATWLTAGFKDPGSPDRGFDSVLEFVREEMNQRLEQAAAYRRDDAGRCRQELAEAETRCEQAKERLRIIETSKGWRMVQFLRGLIGRRW